MAKNKKPIWLRLIRYQFNCLWYHLLFPVGVEEDDFKKKQWRPKE